MESIVPANAILLAIAIVVNTVLAVLVFRNNPQGASNIIFALLSVLISVWLVANYISIHPAYLLSSLLWIRITIFLAIPLTLLVFLLSHTLPHKELQLKKKTLILLLGVMTVVMAIAVSPYAFTGVQIVENAPRPNAGPGIAPFGIFAILMICAAILTLVRKMRSLQGLQRQQVLFVMLGIAMMFGCIIITIFIPAVIWGSNRFVALMPLYTLLFLGMTTYAILKHNLFNVKVISTEIFSVILIVLLLFQTGFASTPARLLLNIAVLAGGILFSFLLIRGVIREIAERERSERMAEELRVANEGLKQLDKAKSAFMSLASHQLRTPLAAIKGYLSMVLEGDFGAVADKAKVALEKVYISNERLVRLVNDFLNVSRIESGRMDFDFQPISIEAVLRDVVQELEPAAQQKKLAVAFEVRDSSLGKIKADEEKLRQVFLNIVDNAIKYTEKGGITVRLERQENNAVIRIIDTGMGMSPEDVPLLFKPFSRGRSARVDTSGSGLGLYIAKQMLLAHKGNIAASSPGLGKGSEFSITLPLDDSL